MNTAGKVASTLVLVLVGSVAAYWSFLYLTLEQPTYEVIYQGEDYELRQYDAYLVAEKTVDGNFEESGNRAFRPLAGYIFGQNEASEEMSMTAPVVSSSDANNGNWTYQFVMESRYTMNTLPAPVDGSIQLKEIPARVVAARRFSGRWLEERVNREASALLEALAKDSVQPLGSVALARYNDPFTPFFLRRNEVLVNIASIQ